MNLNLKIGKKASLKALWSHIHTCGEGQCHRGLKSYIVIHNISLTSTKNIHVKSIHNDWQREAIYKQIAGETPSMFNFGFYPYCIFKLSAPLQNRIICDCGRFVGLTSENTPFKKNYAYLNIVIGQNSVDAGSTSETYDSSSVDR